MRRRSRHWSNCRDRSYAGLEWSSAYLLMQAPCSRQHLIGTRSHANVFGDVNPTHYSGRVHQELSGPGNVVPIRAAAYMQQIVTAYHVRARIGKNSECIASFLAQVPRYPWWVDADRHRANACRFELGQVFLNSS